MRVVRSQDQRMTNPSTRLAVLVLALLGWWLWAGTASAAAATEAWQWPLSPRPEILRGFHPPPVPWGAGHRGVDLAASSGQTVRSAGAGQVAYAGVLAGRGVVVVRHGELRTTYEPVASTVVCRGAGRCGRCAGDGGGGWSLHRPDLLALGAEARREVSGPARAGRSRAAAAAAVGLVASLGSVFAVTGGCRAAAAAEQRAGAAWADALGPFAAPAAGAVAGAVVAGAMLRRALPPPGSPPPPPPRTPAAPGAVIDLDEVRDGCGGPHDRHPPPARSARSLTGMGAARSPVGFEGVRR